MALVIADRVRETSTTTGAGAFTLDGAVTGYQTFLTAIGAGNTCYYTISNPGVNEWEVGIGTVGSGTLTRTTLISSSTGSFVSFTSGSKDVFVTYPAEKAVYLDAAGNITPSLGGATFSSITDTGLTANRVTYAGTGGLLQDSANLTFNGTTLTNTGNAIISANSSSDALRITQVGSGNALLVEDSANPDATPFVIKADGAVVRGYTSSISGSITPMLQAVGADSTSSSIGQYSFSAINSGPILELGLSANATIGSQTVVADGNGLGAIRFSGSDGTQFIRAAQIVAQVDGTPGTNDMPGRLIFSTTADGASSPTERMRISSSGGVGIGTTSIGGYSGTLNVGGSGSPTGGYLEGVMSSMSIPSSVITRYDGFMSTPTTQAASFNLASLRHFYASQGALGAGSTVSNQYGYFVDSNLTGAAFNYGFYGAIAAGTGRWNFYAAGTAANYFEGATTLNSTLGVKTTASAEYNILVAGNLTGGINSGGLRFQSQIQSDVTSNARGIMSIPSTAAAAFTLSNLEHFYAGQGSLGAGSAITNQYGYRAASTLTGATNNYGFYGDIASGTGRWNFYAAGTADNYFAGNVGIGIATPTNKLSIYQNAAVDIYTSSGNSLATWLAGATSAGNYSIYSNNAYAITFATSGVERGRVSSTGVWSLGATAGSESLRVTPVASAVNYLNVYGAAAGNQVNMRAEGSDTNIGFNMTTKGASAYDFYTSTYGAQQFRIAHTASAVNYLSVSGNAAGSFPYMAATGSDTNVSFGYYAKGTGSHYFHTNNSLQFLVANTTSAVDYLAVTGSTAGYPAIIAQGASANVSAVITSKAAGTVILQTGGVTQFLVANTASAVNFLQVQGGATGGSVAISAQGSDTNVGLAINPKGNLGVAIGSSPGVGYSFTNGKNITGSTGSYATIASGTILSDVTGGANIYTSAVSTQATAFTLGNIRHFWALNPSIGAGSSVTSQYGFLADNLTNATNNYGFYGNVASGTGRWNFYAAGTADNYFAGNVGIGITAPQSSLDVGVGSNSAPTYKGNIRVNGGALAGNGGLEFLSTVFGSGFGWRLQTPDLGGGNTPLVFQSRLNTASWTERMRITVDGITSIGAAPGAESLRVTPVASAVNYLSAYGGATGQGPQLRFEGSDTNVNGYYDTKGTGAHLFRTNVYSGAPTQFVISHTASAVNYLQVTGNATGLYPSITATGSDATVGLVLNTKGGASQQFYTGNQLQFTIAHTASAVNYLQVTGAATGLYPTLSAQGSDANITMQYSSKGTGAMLFATGGGFQVAIAHTTSAVNFLSLTGSATGNATSISAAGSDTNIDLALTPKGTGNVKFGTLTANADAPITGYITIKDAAGNLRKLAVIA